jgi:signal transduction histidine kinase
VSNLEQFLEVKFLKLSVGSSALRWSVVLKSSILRGDPQNFRLSRGGMHLSDFISENMESIVQAWEDFARTIEPPALTMDRTALRDHASAMLRVIAKDLTFSQTASEQSEKSKGQGPRDNDDTAAESHADARLLSGYTIEQIVSEFRALRASVLRLWSNSEKRRQDVDPLDIIRFNEAIDQALAESVGRYARAVKKSQNLFLSILGHDLRDPLEQSIMGASLIMSTTYIASKHNEVATGIFKSGQRMLKLVNNLLDFTRTQLGSTLPIKVKKTDIVNICLGAVEELRKNYPERSIEFSAKGNREGLWDEARIAQVFSNLIGNALQHGAQKEPVTVQLDSNSDEIIVRVRNKGTPIDREKMQSIFEPLVRFTEEDSIGHASETSLGIGLYITREIVQSHKGDILVDSSQEGTTFTVRLPRAPLFEGDCTVTTVASSTV